MAGKPPNFRVRRAGSQGGQTYAVDVYLDPVLLKNSGINPETGARENVLPEPETVSESLAYGQQQIYFSGIAVSVQIAAARKLDLDFREVETPTVWDLEFKPIG